MTEGIDNAVFWALENTLKVFRQRPPARLSRVNGGEMICDEVMDFDEVTWEGR